MKEIKFSVCIPLFNRGPYIKYTINSVLNQKYDKYELIIADDGDGSDYESIKDILKSQRIIYKKNEIRLGLVKNWNRCLGLANNEYILLLHHDDLLLPEALYYYAKEIEREPNFGLMHANSYDFFTARSLLIKRDTSTSKSQYPDDPIKRILFNNNIACSTVVLKKEVLQKVGIFNETLWISPDWEMWARIATKFKIVHIPLALAIVIHAQNNTHISGINVKEFVKQHNEYYRIIKRYLSSNTTNIDRQYAQLLYNTVKGLSAIYFKMGKFKVAYEYCTFWGHKFSFLILVLKNIHKYLFRVIISYFTNKRCVYKYLTDWMGKNEIISNCEHAE